MSPSASPGCHHWPSGLAASLLVKIIIRIFSPDLCSLWSRLTGACSHGGGGGVARCGGWGRGGWEAGVRGLLTCDKWQYMFIDLLPTYGTLCHKVQHINLNCWKNQGGSQKDVAMPRLGKLQ